MNSSRLRDALAGSGGALPVEALTWAQAHWSEARPALLSMLTACAKPGDITDREASGAFFAMYLFAGQRDAGAFPVVCALARNADCFDIIMGDALGEHLHRLILGFCDEPQDLEGIIANGACDQFVRVEFLLAWRWLVCSGKISREDAWRFLVAIRAANADVDDGFFANEWAHALISVDPPAAISIVEQAFESGWIDPQVTGLDGLRSRANAITTDPDGERNTFLAENAPFEDVVGSLERWWNTLPAADSSESTHPADDGETVRNPYRDVGRNDPCPCGSGKKFKKCCLPEPEAEFAP